MNEPRRFPIAYRLEVNVGLDKTQEELPLGWVGCDGLVLSTIMVDEVGTVSQTSTSVGPHAAAGGGPRPLPSGELFHSWMERGCEIADSGDMPMVFRAFCIAVIKAAQELVSIERQTAALAKGTPS